MANLDCELDQLLALAIAGLAHLRLELLEVHEDGFLLVFELSARHRHMLAWQLLRCRPVALVELALCGGDAGLVGLDDVLHAVQLACLGVNQRCALLVLVPQPLKFCLSTLVRGSAEDKSAPYLFLSRVVLVALQRLQCIALIRRVKRWSNMNRTA